MFILLFILTIEITAEIHYENYTVHTVIPKNSRHLQILKEMQQDYHFWTQLKDELSPVDIMVPPHLYVDFKNIVSSNAIPTVVMISNVQEQIEKLKRERRDTFNKKMHWHDYHNGEEVNSVVFQRFRCK